MSTVLGLRRKLVGQKNNWKWCPVLDIAFHFSAEFFEYGSVPTSKEIFKLNMKVWHLHWSYGSWRRWKLDIHHLVWPFPLLLLKSIASISSGQVCCQGFGSAGSQAEALVGKVLFHWCIFLCCNSFCSNSCFIPNTPLSSAPLQNWPVLCCGHLWALQPGLNQ